MDIPDLLDNRNFRKLANCVSANDIDREISEKLDVIVSVVESATLGTYG